MRALVAGLLLSLAGCTPFYRVDEVQGRRVADGEERALLQARARELMSAGRAAAAAEAWQAALDLDPSPSADAFLSLAQARAAAGERAAARAAARLGLSAPGGVSQPASRALRELLTRQYAAEGLIEPALDFLPEARLEAALEVPELARALGALADADRLARSAKLESVGRYEQWLGEFGVPTHRLLTAWSESVYKVAAAPVAQAITDADQALTEGRSSDAAQLWALAFRFQAPAAFEATSRARFEAACARSGEQPSTEARSAAQGAREALSSNRLGDALAGARRAVVMAPCWPEARYDLALLLGRVEQHGEALRHLRAFMRRSTDAALVARAQALAVDWERRVDPAQLERLREQERVEAGVLATRRASARRWRDGGFSVMSVGGVLGAGAVACAVIGLRTNEQIQAGAFDTGRDILLAAELGQTANTLGTILAVSAGALVAIGVPIVLFNLDPAAPAVSAVVGPGFSGLAVSGALP